MVSISHDPRPVRKDNFEALSLVLNRSGEGDGAGSPAFVKDTVANLQFAHRGPAERRRDRRVQGKCFTNGRARRQDDEVGALKATQKLVQIGVRSGNAVAGAFTFGERADL